jgi:crotonobetainyl-CoA:carnitine CoA-transferase CaiB-like acyl-CoA transferase
LFVSIPERVKNRAALKVELEKVFTQHTRTSLAELLDRGNIAWGRINTVEDVWSHPALKTKDVVSGDRQATFVRRVCDTEETPRRVPAIGEHSAAIRREFGG